MAETVGASSVWNNARTDALASHRPNGEENLRNPVCTMTCAQAPSQMNRLSHGSKLAIYVICTFSYGACERNATSLRAFAPRRRPSQQRNGRQAEGGVLERRQGRRHRLGGMRLRGDGRSRSSTAHEKQAHCYDQARLGQYWETVSVTNQEVYLLRAVLAVCANSVLSVTAALMSEHLKVSLVLACS